MPTYSMSSARVIGVLAAAACVFAGAAFAQAPRDDAAGRESAPSGPLTAARYAANGDLQFPADADGWIFVGSGLGGDYVEGAFDAADPGPITVVQMEPSAYRYFRANGRYADGTMLLLTFYGTQQKPEPQLRGFVQGDVVQREIHVIDRARFAEEGRAFFVFGATGDVAPKVAVGSACVECHTEHGRFDATFSQFYPAVRAHLRAEADARQR